MNKILIFGGLAVFAVLLIENMVISTSAYVLWFISKGYVLVFISTLVGFFIGYGLKGFLNGEDKRNDGDLDF